MDSLFPLQLGFSWGSLKARSWNCLNPYVCLAWEDSSSWGLEELELCGNLSVHLWFLYHGGFKVDGFSPGGSGLQRYSSQGERARWKPYHLLWPSVQSHAVLFPLHPICGGSYRDPPSLKGPLPLNEGMLPSRCEKNMRCTLMRTSLENRISHTCKRTLINI